MATATLGDEDTLPLFALDSTEGVVRSDTAWREVAGPAMSVAVPDFLVPDFETYYTSSFSIANRELNQWGYVAHPAFNAYLVAFTLYKDGRWWSWVGRPADAPWADCAKVAQWVSHNASFDELVFRRLKKDGVVKVAVPELWDCTADLAAYFQLDRALERCVVHLLGETSNKTVRAKAKAGLAGAEEMRDYAATDARQCAWIWARHSPRWSSLEREVSRLQRRAGYLGLHADQPLMAEAKQRMLKLQREVVMRIPWANRFPVTSSKGIAIECAKLGIPVLPSRVIEDPEVEAWQKRYGRLAPWLEDLRTHAKAQQVLTHVESMQERTRRDGTIPFELVYRRAPHTARWQSMGGLRIQNLDRDEFHGVNVRGFIDCPPGYDLLSVDSSQIEPRVLNWLVGDKAFLAACRKGQSPYDAHAVSTMAYVAVVEANGRLRRLKDANPALYALAKARLLALGYQAAAPKFCEMAKTMAGITVFENESSYCPDLSAKSPEFFAASQIRDRLERNDLAGWSIFPPAVECVRDFREKSPLIVDKWGSVEEEMARCHGRDHVVQLPNGERITYFDVEVSTEYNEERRRNERKLRAWLVKESRNHKHHVETYGGKLVENRVQRISRDLLCYWKAEVVRQLSRYGLSYRWSVHDELNAYAPKAESKHLLEAMLGIMSTPPAWASDLPVSAEGHVLQRYRK